MIVVRDAVARDADGMCAVINPLIAAGGTTAHRVPFDGARIGEYFLAPAGKVSCVLAEEDGAVLGFQAVKWAAEGWWGADVFPALTGSISSFVGPGVQGRGIGRGLFAESCERARADGAEALEATIRLENALGRGYYEAMGFVECRRDAERVLGRYYL